VHLKFSSWLQCPVALGRFSWAVLYKERINLNGPQRISKTEGEIAHYQNSLRNGPFETISVGQFLTFLTEKSPILDGPWSLKHSIFLYVMDI
jgi:hypothetical protein